MTAVRPACPVIAAGACLIAGDLNRAEAPAKWGPGIRFEPGVGSWRRWWQPPTPPVPRQSHTSSSGGAGSLILSLIHVRMLPSITSCPRALRLSAWASRRLTANSDCRCAGFSSTGVLRFPDWRKLLPSLAEKVRPPIRTLLRSSPTTPIMRPGPSRVQYCGHRISSSSVTRPPVRGERRTCRGRLAAS
jgi:hypothetical protein